MIIPIRDFPIRIGLSVLRYFYRDVYDIGTIVELDLITARVDYADTIYDHGLDTMAAMYSDLHGDHLAITHGGVLIKDFRSSPKRLDKANQVFDHIVVEDLF